LLLFLIFIPLHVGQTLHGSDVASGTFDIVVTRFQESSISGKFDKSGWDPPLIGSRVTMQTGRV